MSFGQGKSCKHCAGAYEVGVLTIPPLHGRVFAHGQAVVSVAESVHSRSTSGLSHYVTLLEMCVCVYVCVCVWPDA